MNLDIPDLLKTLEVDERIDETGGKVVQGECETIFRLSETKLRPPTLGKGEFLRSFVAVDLALGVLGISFSKQALLKRANNAKEKTYDDTYRRIRFALGSRVVPTGGNISNLAVMFPGTSAPRSWDLLRKYQDACRTTVTAEHGNRLVERYSTPEYHAAAFCVASVEDQYKLDRKAVADVVKLQAKDLDKICADIVTKCGLSGLKHVAKAFRVEAAGSGDGDQGGGEGGGEGGGVGGRGGTKGKGKQPLSPREQGGQQVGGPGDDSDERSPAIAPTTRLDGLGAGDVSPTSPGQADRPLVTAASARGTEKRLQFLDTGRSGAAPTSPVDHSVSLNLFVKRLRTLRSKSYEDWCLKTLGPAAAAD